MAALVYHTSSINPLLLPTRQNTTTDKNRKENLVNNLILSKRTHNMATFEEQFQLACDTGDIPGVLLLASDAKGM